MVIGGLHVKSLTLEIGGLFEELDHLAVERRLAVMPGVHRAEANPASGSVTVIYDETAITKQELEDSIRDCGFHSGGDVVPRHQHAKAPAAAPAGHPPAHDAAAYEMGRGAGMDMPIWSATCATVSGWRQSSPFLRATIAVVWPSWPFFVAAWRALRNGILNMAVLVVLSVGTGYFFSAGSTFFFPGVQLYEAVAVLLVFILLGHWHEMRACAGASAAIRALLDLRRRWQPSSATAARSRCRPSRCCTARPW